MPWFVFMGADDGIFAPATCQTEYDAVFSARGMTSQPKYDVIATGVGHSEDSRFYDVML